MLLVAKKLTCHEMLSKDLKTENYKIIIYMLFDIRVGGKLGLSS